MIRYTEHNMFIYIMYQYISYTFDRIIYVTLNIYITIFLTTYRYIGIWFFYINICINLKKCFYLNSK